MGSFATGLGTIVTFYRLQEGSVTEPTEASLTTAASATAKGATTITLSGAIGAGVLIPSGTWLEARQTNGKTIPFQLSADAEAADTTLAVEALPEAITASATIAYPLVLTNRTAAEIGRTGTRTESVVFEDGLWSSGRVTKLEAPLNLPGNYDQFSAAYRNLELMMTAAEQGYISIQLDTKRPGFTKGVRYHGIFSVLGLPANIAADGIITGDISLQIEGELFKDDPTPTA